MADWKTYAKAARNTARKQAPGARDAAKRATSRAGDYARAAGRAVDAGRDDQQPPASGHGPQVRRDRERGQDSSPRPPLDAESLRKGAAAYYTVAERRVRSAGIVPRILRSVRDAVLIGLSLLVIWLVLAAAGLQIPFSAVVIVVLVIVVISFGTGMYSRFRYRGTETESEPGEEDPAP
ncbi:hypothetical protein BH708_18340 [Brachybacterium sp. P6-10-X1]|uniref:hypothetical protein n=1 Tax=Brachybacterium sp. P6-10-X1 TaxID=1903186 RepID=UPI000971AD48|nr:hypothetical protein [Brachybacterium sp. P6-10-X1]APX34343.1 hypothetical protein BH708_18340 [Brachybacterium sp. P6-10-X1]